MTRLQLFSAVAVACFSAVATAFPNVPFKAVGREIQDSTGANITYVGANWPGHGEVMIPEGLQYQSISSIVGQIKTFNFNVIRLTFAIEMLDNIIDGGADVSIQAAFVKALGQENGTKVMDAVIKNNPEFKPETTRLQVFDAVAAELSKQGVYVHLDNHVSKGQWCCNGDDGNSWFGDTHFNVKNWIRGLAYMAEHGKNWDSLVSIGLRNELRRAEGNRRAEPYNWASWYDNMIPAGDAVNAANPDLLIFYSGLDFDTDLSPLPDAQNLGGGRKFVKSKFRYADKLVLEQHNYEVDATDCEKLKDEMWNSGFKAMDQAGVNIMPVVLTEFGYAQDGQYTTVYASCIRDWIPDLGAGWMVWLLGGSYYTRQGIQDYDDTWGILNHDWSGWRTREVIDKGLGVMIKDSYSQ